ncbi:hypothetical protein [Povalibacter sp.]|uniref:hypothetical protein n=1 Tax=Povalibacter sp. TaxID=1962978 RepID=UPI002F41FB23
MSFEKTDVERRREAVEAENERMRREREALLEYQRHLDALRNANRSPSSGRTPSSRSRGSNRWVWVIALGALVWWYKDREAGAPTPASLMEASQPDTQTPRETLPPLSVETTPPAQAPDSLPHYGDYRARLETFLLSAGMRADAIPEAAKLIDDGLVSLPETQARQVRVNAEDGSMETFAMAAPVTADGNHSALFCFSGEGNLVLQRSDNPATQTTPLYSDARFIAPDGTEVDLNATIAFETNSCRALFDRINSQFGYLPYVRDAMNVTDAMKQRQASASKD